MSKTDILRIPDYLGHIVEAIERIYRYIEDSSEIDFLNDEKTQDAVIRSLKLLAKPPAISNATIVRLPRITRKSLGHSCTLCVIESPTAILKSI